MKTPGDYALLHANGMPWKDVVAAIRAEALADYRQVPFTNMADESESAAPYVEFYDTSGVE